MGDAGYSGDPGPVNFLVPCVLLMLERAPRRPEQLRELVAAFGFRRKAAEMEGLLLRLRDDRLVDSSGDVSGAGCGGPRYALTAAGQRWLADRSQALTEPARLVRRFLDRYPVAGVPGPPETAAPPKPLDVD